MKFAKKYYVLKNPKVWRKFLNLALLFILIAYVASCANAKNAVYFNENAFGDYSFPSRVENLEPVLMANDLLSITVSSVNPEAAEMFNVGNTADAQSASNTGGSLMVSGYLIGQDGFIRFPILGEIMAMGKTKNALRAEITQILQDRKLLLEPIVDIRYLNYKISILGEVKNPSVLTIPSEKISLLEALGLAGDITIYGRKDNVTLIREKNGKKKLIKLDLTSRDIFTSPYYYLQSNDIIYVEPTKARIASSGEAKLWIPVILSAISLAVITILTAR